MANRYWLLLIFLGAIWGSAFMFIKIATPDLGPVFLVNIRLFIAGLMFLPILLQSKYLKLLRSNLRNILFLAVINNALPFTLFSYASLFSSSNMLAIFNGSTAIITAIISVLWLKNKISRIQFIGVLTGLIGIIVLAMAILPTLQIGGMQLLHMEHDDPYEKTIPKVNRFVIELFLLYVSLSIICAFLYFVNGMKGFDSIIHAMTTISTGGFSNYNDSFFYFNSFQIEIISIIFMLVGSLPFVLYLQFLHNQKKLIFKDDQIKLFFLILFIIILLTTIWLITNQSIDAISAFRIALFNITSILTGTGYTSSNFSNWGSFGIVIMMIIMFIGGCAGSTTGGIKIFRLQILFRGAITQIRKLTQPHAVLMMRFNGKSVNENTYNSIMGFFFMYIFLFILSAVSLSLFNLDFLTAFSAAASAISNVGPGLGEIIGPSGNYFFLDNGAKWILAITMIIGRLEIFTVLVLLSMNFWRS